MSRGIGVIEPIQQLIPDWFAIVIALSTQLGDVWFLALLLGSLYWRKQPSHDQMAFVIGIWLTGLGLYNGLKEFFRLPRPEQPILDVTVLPEIIQPVYEATAFATGYGFPSGHAVNSTIVYFGLASVLTLSTRRRRYRIAALFVAVVCFSRVALGLHYLVDVVVGVIVGILLLFVAKTVVLDSASDPASVMFGVAIGSGGFFAWMSSGHPESLLLVGASLGAFAGWQVVLLGRSEETGGSGRKSARGVLLRRILVALIGVLLIGALLLSPLSSAYGLGGLVGIALAGGISIPVIYRENVSF